WGGRPRTRFPWSATCLGPPTGFPRVAGIPHGRPFTSVPIFVDTNVFVYARDATDQAKHARAADWIRELWHSGEGRLSFQVLQEYYVTTTRKLEPGLRPLDARADVEDLLAWQPIPVQAPALRLAWSI